MRSARKYGAILVRDRRRPVACITPAREEPEVNRFAAWRPLKRFAAAIDRPGLWKLADPTAALLREVQAARSRLNRRVFVRSLDAIHLVTAKAEGFERIYSNDPHLLDAAKSFGLEGVNPISR